MGLGKIVKSVGGALGFGGGGGGDSGPPPPDLSELEALKSKQAKAASDFRTNMSGMQSEQDRASRMTARQELARNLGDVRSAAASRGLLYSGLKQKGDVQANQGAAANIATQSAQTAAQLEDQARGLEDQATATGISLQMAKSGMANDAFATALGNRQQRTEALGQLGQGLGSLGGSYFANRSGGSNIPDTIPARRR